jgi:MinD superfamily P-loop ATPase
MIISIASGKGGTGKTTLAVNLAHYLSRTESVSLLDCDVEEPNDHLFLNFSDYEESPVNIKQPFFDEKQCTACGKCVEACNFNALALAGKSPIIFNELCHSCGACKYVCSTGAISEGPHAIGKIFKADSNNDPFQFSYGLLNIGETLAPEIIKQLKSKHIENNSINIIDSAPGTGCSVVEALNDAEVVVLVTEPTPFGLHDLKLAVQLSLKMKIRTGIVINRSDGNDDLIVKFAESSGVPIIGQIPYHRKYAVAYSKGQVLVEEFAEFADKMKEIYDNILKLRDSQIPEVPIGEEIKELMPVSDMIHLSSLNDTLKAKELVIISGKGGTGKTTITASLAQLSENKVLFDADVDAADLALLIKSLKTQSYAFSGGLESVIDPDKCFGCGKCAELCRFNAIDLKGPGNDVIAQTYSVDPVKCEGCGLCNKVCPADAIRMQESWNGKWMISETSNGPLVHAELGIGEENSGKLVSTVRNASKQIADQNNSLYILGDGPPGTGCPVIASITGANMVIVVTEPTISGLHDLTRVLKLTNYFGVKSLIIINKSDINAEMTQLIYAEALQYGCKVIAEIPFDKNVHDSLMAGKTIVEHGKGPAFEIINVLWDTIRNEMKS